MQTQSLQVLFHSTLDPRIKPAHVKSVFYPGSAQLDRPHVAGPSRYVRLCMYTCVHECVADVRVSNRRKLVTSRRCACLYVYMHVCVYAHPCVHLCGHATLSLSLSLSCVCVCVWTGGRVCICYLMFYWLDLTITVICLNTSSPFMYMSYLELSYVWVLLIYMFHWWYVSKQISF